MTVRYVRSTDGGDSDDGLSWANAKATLVGADASPDAAGDIIYVSQAHAESLSTGGGWTFAGTAALPTQVLCVNDGAEPPTTLAATGSQTQTGATLSLNGNVYVHGLTFTVGGGTSNYNLIIGGGGGGGYVQHYKSCAFRVTNTNLTTYIGVGANSNIAGNNITWEDCTVRFAASAQGVQVFTSTFRWIGGGIEAGGTEPAALLEVVGTNNTGRGVTVLVEGLDLSGASSSLNLLGSIYGGGSRVTFRNCRLPSGWAGSLQSGNFEPGCIVRMHNCDSGDTNYREWTEYYSGSIVNETTLVRTGGASDGTTGLSLKLASNANCGFPHATLDTDEIPIWNDTTGSAITATVEILHDSATDLNDDEVWLEVVYLGTSGYPQGSLVTDRRAIMASAAAQTTSGETWTTSGMSNPNEQKLAVTFTPQEKGYILAKVRMAKASYTVYVDPLVTLT